MSLTVPVQEIVAESNDPLLAIHPTWERVPLGAIAEILNGFAFKSAFFNRSKGMPLLRIRDVGKDQTECFYEGDYEPRYVVRAGNLIVGMDGDFKCTPWYESVHCDPALAPPGRKTAKHTLEGKPPLTMDALTR